MDIQLPDYISAFGETYKKESESILHLLKNAAITENQKVKNSVNNYLKKYTMLPTLWRQWIGYETNILYFSYTCKNIILESQKHFPVSELLFKCFFEFFFLCNFNLPKMHFLLPTVNRSFSYEKCLLWIESKKDYDFAYYHAIQALKCPHENLEENLIYCLAFSDSPLQNAKFVQLYNKNFKLYNELIVADENEDQWLNCLRKSDNVECIIQNIEYRISLEPANTKLWKFLINVLEELNQNVLPIYKRYCHLFLNDKEMRKMYRKAIKKFSHHYQTKWWIDLIEIEKDFETEESASKLMKSIIQNEFGQNSIETHANYDFNESFKLFKNFAKIKDTEIIFMLKKSEELPYIQYQNMISLYSAIFNFSIPQNFCFPSFLINYIIKQQNSYNLQNLKMSCKFFLYKIKANYCHMLVMHEYCENEKSNINFSKQSIFTHTTKIFKNSKKICITNSIIIHYRDLNFRQNIILKINNCGIRYISLMRQKLAYSDFLFLTSSKKVEYLYLSDVSIHHEENNQGASLEEILTLIPKTQFFHFEYKYYSTEIFDRFLKSLVKYKHPVPFSFFRIARVTSFKDLNATHFYIFMMNNAKKDSRFSIEFENDKMRDTFKTNITQFLEPCWIIQDKPYKLVFKHEKT